MTNRTTGSETARARGWIVGASRPGRPAARLFCLPYAGGSASLYTTWGKAFGDIEVCPIEPPGRRARWRESAFVSLPPLVEALASALVEELDVPYALFGHSMGGLVAFELVRELRRRGLREPCALIVSGAAAPQLPSEYPNVHDQSDAHVVDRLRSLGAASAEVFSEPELLELLLPTLRADFSVLETYVYRAEMPLTTPIVAIAGDADREVPANRMTPWLEQTSAGFDHRVLPGDHFFPWQAEKVFINTVRASIRTAMA